MKHHNNSTRVRLAALAVMIAGAQNALAIPHRDAMPDVSCHFEQVEQKQQPEVQAIFHSSAYSEAIAAWFAASNVTRSELTCAVEDNAVRVSSPAGSAAPDSASRQSI